MLLVEMFMPGWDVHCELAEMLCGIPKDIMNNMNKVIDELTYHDINRIIVKGHWNPLALLHESLFHYENWGYIGIKAALHHHLLDYAATLLTGGKYGYLLKEKVYLGLAVSSVIKFVESVLNHIEEDFTVLTRLSGSLLESEFQNIVENFFEKCKYWDDPKARNEAKRYMYYKTTLVRESSQALIRASKELKDCIKDCIWDLAIFKLWKDHCIVCKNKIEK